MGGTRQGGRIDWWGNVTFAVGLSALLIAVTDGIQPYGRHAMGWTNPAVLALLAGGAVLLGAFVVIETNVVDPLFEPSLFRIRPWRPAVHAHHLVAGDLAAPARLCLQPNAAMGRHLPPAADGGLPHLGPLAGMVVFGASFIGLLALPVRFPYWAFALLIAANGIGSGMFAAPNTSSIMSSVPAKYRGIASGMRSTFQNSGTALSIGVVFAIMTRQLAGSLPRRWPAACNTRVPHAIAHNVGSLPPVASLSAAVLGVNPCVLQTLPAAAVHTITGREFFPDFISGPFHHGLGVVFAVSAALAALAGLASLLRGKRPVPMDTEETDPALRRPLPPPAQVVGQAGLR